MLPLSVNLHRIRCPRRRRRFLFLPFVLFHGTLQIVFENQKRFAIDDRPRCIVIDETFDRMDETRALFAREDVMRDIEGGEAEDHE